MLIKRSNSQCHEREDLTRTNFSFLSLRLRTNKQFQERTLSMSIQLIKRLPLAIQPRIFSPFFFFSSFSQPSEEAYSDQSLVTVVVSILTHHRSKSRWSHLHSFCPSGFNPTDFSKITIHLKNNPYLGLRFFSWTQNKSLCNHNLVSYASIIHILARGHLKTQALNIIRTAILSSELEEDKDDQNPLKSRPLNVFETLVKTYKDCGSAPFVFGLLIKACLELRKVDCSIEIVRMLLSRRISPKVSTLNSLIYRVCQCQGFEAGYRIYREVFGLDEESERSTKRGFKVGPSVPTYNALMVCYYEDGLMEEVKKIWDEITEFSCAPNAYSHSVLMATCCEEGRMEDAEKLWVEMRNKEMEPSVVTYNTIIGGYCKIGEVERAEGFFREMALRGFEGTAVTYEHLIKGYCYIRDVESALLVYEDMSRKALMPEASTLDILIELMCDKDGVNEALKLLGSAMDKFGLLPKQKTYENLIKRLCNEGRMAESLKLQAEMVGRGFQPNLEIYDAFIEAYIRQGNKEVAEALRKEMLQTQIQS